MNKLTIIQRTVLGYLVLVLLVVFLGVSSLAIIRTLSNSLDGAYSQVLPVVERATSLKEPAYVMQARMNDYVRATSDAERRQAEQSLVAANDLFRQNLAQLEAELPEVLVGRLNFEDVANRQQRVMAGSMEQLRLTDSEAELLEAIFLGRGVFVEFWRGFGLNLQQIGNQTTDPILLRQLRAFERAGNPVLVHLEMALDARTLADFEVPATTVRGVVPAMDRVIDFVRDRDPDLAGRFNGYRNRLYEVAESEFGLLNLQYEVLEQGAATSRKRQQLGQEYDQLLESLNVLLQPVNAFAQVEQESAAGSVRSAVQLVVGLIVGAIAMAALVGYSTVHSIRVPVKRTLEAIERISTGDFTQPVHVQGRDELAQIGRFINSLIERLAHSIKGVAETANSLQQAAQDSMQVARETLAGTEQQRVQTDSIATAIHEMESAVAEVAQSTESARSQVDELREAALTNRQNMHSSLASIAELSKHMQDAGDVIGQVQKRSQDITGILTVIQGVSEQTNLLALNAAIEAARAGDAGRGFAVVADEVRSLATKTRDSAEEINQMITALVQASSKAVGLVSTAGDQLERVVSQSELTGTSLESMTASLEEVGDRSVQIATAAVEQSEVAREINQNILQIAHLAQQAADGAGRTNATSAEVMRLAEQQAKLISSFRYQ